MSKNLSDNSPRLQLADDSTIYSNCEVSDINRCCQELQNDINWLVTDLEI